MVNSHGSREVKKGTADAIRQVDDAYNRTRLTRSSKVSFERGCRGVTEAHREIF